MFVRNHEKAIIACDFFIVVTATFRLVYGFVIMEVGPLARPSGAPGLT